MLELSVLSFFFLFNLFARLLQLYLCLKNSGNWNFCGLDYSNILRTSNRTWPQQDHSLSSHFLFCRSLIFWNLALGFSIFCVTVSFKAQQFSTHWKCTRLTNGTSVMILEKYFQSMYILVWLSVSLSGRVTVPRRTCYVAVSQVSWWLHIAF